MVIAALLMVAKTWKQPKCPPVDDWIKKMWRMYTMEFSAMRKDEILLLCVTTWMDLENVMLSKISQMEKVRTT